MIIISHRRNSLEALQSTPTQYGIEVDIRSSGNDLIIHHDPFQAGLHFEDWLSHYHHNTLILNVKEEGLEHRLIDLMNKGAIEDYFFLDQSFPFLVKTAKEGEQRCAVRYSEFESFETIKSLAGQIRWVWVDCFTQYPQKIEEYHQIKNLGFSVCLVSPELQGREAATEIPLARDFFEKVGISIDAVCTKVPQLWE